MIFGGGVGGARVVMRGSVSGVEEAGVVIQVPVGLGREVDVEVVGAGGTVGGRRDLVVGGRCGKGGRGSRCSS